MTIYLRTKENRTVVDIELYKTSDEGTGHYIELSSSVSIEHYSKLLLDVHSKTPERVPLMIETFDGLQELRGWLWEVYFMGEQNDVEEFPNVLKELKNMLAKVADEYDLHIITD